MTVIKYGLANSLPARDFGPSFTVGDLLIDTATLGYLSAPEGCAAVSQGETLSTHELVSNHSSITLEKQAASKAA